MRTLKFQFLRILFSVCLGSTALASASFSASNDTATPVKAIWKIHELDFAYMGITTHYSCDGLRDRVASILLQLGARPDVWVRSGACDEFTGPARMPSVRIVAALPVEATDAAVAAQKADVKRDALIAKMRKASKRGQAYSEEPFDAAPKNTVISHKDKSTYGAVSGDCELLEQLARDVLPKMGIKIVRKSLNCMPHASTLSAQLEVESLTLNP